MSREHYTQQLHALQDDLLRLASVVESAVTRSVAALAAQNVVESRQLIAEDDQIDRRQYELEDRALQLIARQAPLAADLRLISAVISIASELERIGDYAEGIAEITIRGAGQPLLKLPQDVPRMAELAVAMLHDAVTAFIRRDAAAAHGLAERDDEIDALTTVVQNELLSCMLADPDAVERALHLLFVTHNLERVADRTTNIAERVVFLVTGEVVELNG